jgi:hypothetical protein
MNALRTITALALFGLISYSISAQQAGSAGQQTGMEPKHGKHAQTQQHHERMGGMMQDCHNNMQAMMQEREKTRTDIQTAKQSNDASKMRSALDEAEQALNRMDDHMKSCMTMMSTMENMHQRMMSGQNKQQPAQKPRE